MIVTFIKNSTPYMAGEQAGFPDARAKALIAAGVAIQAEPSSVAAIPDPAAIVTKPMPQSSPATFTARHAGSGRWRVFDAADKPVTDAMDKAAAIEEAKRRNAGG